jgi:hypothetical protein
MHSNKNSNLETSLHLFQPPRYRGANDKNWDSDLTHLIAQQPKLTWDLGTVLSTLSYGFALGNRTLFHEIKRQPWLSEIDENGDVVEMPIPPHGLKGGEAKVIGKRLFELMCDEAERACAGRDQIYLLLSGGLDSRVVGGVVKHLHKSGRIKGQISALTWGINECRDVVYGKCVAERLGFPWTHAVLDQEHYFNNIDRCAERLAASVSPAHLHRMDWFENASPDTLVLAGSFGNMIGRGQLTSRSMLEVLPVQPFNYLNLLNEAHAIEGIRICRAELEATRRRAPAGLPEYVYREHEQCCHFSRGMLAQTMNIINDHCKVYQMLTAPEIYSYIWSRHPAVRTDDVYAEVLELVGREVASVPWSRTNRALKGTDESLQRKLSKKNSRYRLWTHEYLNSSRFDQDSFLHQMNQLEFLDQTRLEFLINAYRSNENACSTEADQFSWTIAWLLSLDKFIQSIDQHPTHATPPPVEADRPCPSAKTPWTRSVRKLLANNSFLRVNVAKLRRRRATRSFLAKHPIEPDDS